MITITDLDNATLLKIHKISKNLGYRSCVLLSNDQWNIPSRLNVFDIEKDTEEFKAFVGLVNEELNKR